MQDCRSEFEPSVTKKVKVDVNENTMQFGQFFNKSTQEVSQQFNEDNTQFPAVDLKPKVQKYNQLQIEIAQQQPVNFLSLRERFQHLAKENGQINYPLPIKFQLLFEKFRQIDFNIWKKGSVLLQGVDIIRLRQLLTLDPMLFKYQVIDNVRVEVEFQNSLGQIIQPFNNERALQLPFQLQQRQQMIRTLLDQLVQVRHDQFLTQIQQQHFLSLSQKMKIYHERFTIDSQEEIMLFHIPGVQRSFTLFECESMKQTLLNLYDFYQKRGVSFMFYQAVKTHMSNDLNQLESLIKLLPDIIKLKNEDILQFNKNVNIQEQQQRIAILSS